MGFFRAFAFRVCKFLQGSFLVLLGIVVGSWVLFYALASTDAMDTVNRYFSWNWPMLFIVVFFLFPLAAVLGGLVTAAAGVTSARRLVAIGVIAAWAVWVAPASHLIDFRSPVNAFLEAAGATIAGAGAATAANFWMHHMTPLYHRWNNDYVAPYFGVHRLRTTGHCDAGRSDRRCRRRDVAVDARCARRCRRHARADYCPVAHILTRFPFPFADMTALKFVSSAQRAACSARQSPFVVQFDTCGSALPR